EQAALAGAIAADDADLGPRIKREPNVLQHLALAVGFAQLLDGEDILLGHAVPAIGSARREAPGRSIVRNQISGGGRERKGKMTPSGAMPHEVVRCGGERI